LAIVARVSTEDQEEYGTSLDVQLAKGQLLAQLHDFTVYTQDGRDDIYRGDESGALPLIHRPIMRRLMISRSRRCATRRRITRRCRLVACLSSVADTAIREETK
jgi:hypothetical protein